MTTEKNYFCNRSKRNIEVTENRIPVPNFAPIVTRFCNDKQCPMRTDCEYGKDNGDMSNIKYIIPNLS